MTKSQKITEFGSGLLATRVYCTGPGRYLWERRPGALRGGGLQVQRRAAEALSEQVAGLPARVTLVTPTGGPDRLQYLVTGSTSAAFALMGVRDQAPTPMLEFARGLGAVLRRIHDLRLPAMTDLPCLPPTLHRLEPWLATGAGPGAAERVYHAAQRVLGGDRVALVRDWYETIRTATDRVPLHGAPGLGSLILPRYAEEPACLLAGEELAFGPVSVDLGWLLGEFLEFRLTSRISGRSADSEDVVQLVKDFLRGWGWTADSGELGRIILLRIVTHMHDYGAYVGWSEHIDHYFRLLADLFGEDGLCAHDHLVQVDHERR